MVARACDYLYDNVSNMASMTVWAGIPSAALGAVTACVIKGIPAMAAGVLFGGAAAVMFSTMFLVIMFVRTLFMEGDPSPAWAIINISALLAPIGGWAACAAAGFALTALQIAALTISTYIGGLLGIWYK